MAARSEIVASRDLQFAASYDEWDPLDLKHGRDGQYPHTLWSVYGWARAKHVIVETLVYPSYTEEPAIFEDEVEVA